MKFFATFLEANKIQLLFLLLFLTGTVQGIFKHHDKKDRIIIIQTGEKHGGWGWGGWGHNHKVIHHHHGHGWDGGWHGGWQGGSSSGGWGWGWGRR